MLICGRARGYQGDRCIVSRLESDTGTCLIPAEAAGSGRTSERLLTDCLVHLPRAAGYGEGAAGRESPRHLLREGRALGLPPLPGVLLAGAWGGAPLSPDTARGSSQPRARRCVCGKRTPWPICLSTAGSAPGRARPGLAPLGGCACRPAASVESPARSRRAPPEPGPGRPATWVQVMPRGAGEAPPRSPSSGTAGRARSSSLRAHVGRGGDNRPVSTWCSSLGSGVCWGRRRGGRGRVSGPMPRVTCLLLGSPRPAGPGETHSPSDRSRTFICSPPVTRNNGSRRS